jgi:hypothetical protein
MDPAPLSAVRDPAIVFPPCAFVRVGLEQMLADPVVNAKLRAAQPGEKGLY